MRTYYFCCDSSKEMELWMRAMSAASLVHAQPVTRLDITKLDHPPPAEMNHRLLIRPETNNNQKNKELSLSRGEDKSAWEAEKYGFQKDGQERPLTRISGVRPQPSISDYDILALSTAQHRAGHLNGPESRRHDGHLTDTDSRGWQRTESRGHLTETDSRGQQRTESRGHDGHLTETDSRGQQRTESRGHDGHLTDTDSWGQQRTESRGHLTETDSRGQQRTESRGHDGHLTDTDSRGQQRSESSRVIQRTSSMQQLEQWIRTQREKSPEEETGGVLSYQTLPRNMPSYRAPVVPRYPEGYRTLPRNLKPRPESVCSTTGTLYERTAPPLEEKRRSVRDDTMWQLYEWQQRQFYQKQSTLRRHSSLTSPKTMVHISEQTLHPIPMSPSHGSISGYHTYSPHRVYRSEVSSPVQRRDLTIERRPKLQPNKIALAPERRSVSGASSLQTITPQALQGKTPEELTLLLIKLRRQQAEMSTIREHTLSQLLHLKQACSPENEMVCHHLQRHLVYVDHQMKDNEPLISMVHTMIENSALRPQLYQQITPEDCRTSVYKHRSEELDIDAKLSRLCEQDKEVQALEQKLQQLHKEKYTLEQALLSASQEIEMNADNVTAIQSVVLQRDELQSGLLSTCREVSRATAELERSWREYDTLERDVTTARNQMRERLERLGAVQTESAGIQRAQMQKEIWRIQDVVEGLSKHKQQRPETGHSEPKALSSGLSSAEEEELVPPRPPLPRSYDFADAAPSLPHIPRDSSSSLLCYSRGPVHLPDDKSHTQVYQRNGSYSGPDYRLYKSEPELTTVTEVDESNVEERADLTLAVEAAAVKGSHFPVGVVPPRTKSPPLESSTIASYVTLRKSKKLDTKSERPRSAVEHLCIAESPRPRMTLEEQLERMRRHQAACLKERKKGFSLLSSSEQSPCRSPSLSGENSATLMQLPKKEKEKEGHALEVSAQTPAPPKLIPGSLAISDKGAGDGGSAESSAHEAKDDGAEDPLPETPTNCFQVLTSVPKHKPESDVGGASREAELSGILFSYDFSADTLRRQTAGDVGTVPSLPEAQTPAPPQPALSEGSHFMCV